MIVSHYGWQDKLVLLIESDSEFSLTANKYILVICDKKKIADNEVYLTVREYKLRTLHLPEVSAKMYIVI